MIPSKDSNIPADDPDTFPNVPVEAPVTDRLPAQIDHTVENDPEHPSAEPVLEDTPQETAQADDSSHFEPVEAIDEQESEPASAAPAADSVDIVRGADSASADSAADDSDEVAETDLDDDIDVEDLDDEEYDDLEDDPEVKDADADDTKEDRAADADSEVKAEAQNASEPKLPRAVSFAIKQENLVNSTAFGHVEVAGDFVWISGQKFEWSNIDEDQLELQVTKYFVEPAGFQAIVKELNADETRVVILAAPEGGHDFAGRALLHACKDMKPKRIGPRSGPKVLPEELAHLKGTAWLMNLTDLEKDTKWGDLFEHFNGLQEELRKQQSALVVIVNSADVKNPSLIGKHDVKVIRRPNPYLVFEKHLVQAFEHAELKDTTKTASEWREHLNRLEQLHKRPPAEAARLCAAVFYTERRWKALNPHQRKEQLAELIQQERLPEDAKITDCVEVLVRDRFDSWSTELDRWNQQHLNDPLIKAFQVAAALHPSRDPAKAREAAIKLLADAFPDDQPPRSLNGPGVRLMVGMIGAELERGKIVFPRPGFQEAVVRYFWDDRMEIQGDLLTWMMGLVPKARPTDKATMAVREQLVERIGYFAIHHAQQRGKLDFLKQVILAWATGDEQSQTDAARLMEAAAEASMISRAVRSLMLRWVQGTDPVKKRVVAQVCTSPTFASRHPRLMAVRLMYVVGDDQGENAVPEQTRLEASELLIRAGDTDIVLETISACLTSDDKEVKQRGKRLFVATAQVSAENKSAPELIRQAAAVEETRAKLVQLWAVALRHLRREDLQPAFDAWMNTCATAALEDLVLSIVLNAVRAKGPVATIAAMVHTLADRWRDVSVFEKERTEELVARFQSEATMISENARSNTFRHANSINA